MMKYSQTSWSVTGLLAANLIFALASVATKLASCQDMFSFGYFLMLGITALIMSGYAVLWQQILKRVEVTFAYMFRGTSIIFTLLLSALLFGESISVNNIVGALIIICGIVMFVKL